MLKIETRKKNNIYSIVIFRDLDRNGREQQEKVHLSLFFTQF